MRNREKWPRAYRRGTLTTERESTEREKAKLNLALLSTPVQLLRFVKVADLMVAFDIHLHPETVTKLKREFIRACELNRAAEVSMEGRNGINSKGAQQQQAGAVSSAAKPGQAKQVRSKPAQAGRASAEQVGQQLVIERIGNILSKSYPHLGDDEKIGTEDALKMIYKEVKHYDPTAITRNEKRALPKQTPSQFNMQPDHRGSDRPSQ
jgi:hypothetical protein